MKTCKKCGSTKSSEEFYANRNGKDGLTGACKECIRSSSIAHRNKNIEAYRAYDAMRANAEHRVQARAEYCKTEAGKVSGARAKAKWQSENKGKRAAHIAVGNALRGSKIAKPCSCTACGKSARLYAHHDDYSKPLDIRWLCSSCHAAWHKKNDPVTSDSQDADHSTISKLLHNCC